MKKLIINSISTLAFAFALTVGLLLGAASNPARAALVLQTLTAIVNGNQTTYSVDNANPLWAIGIPMQSPIITSAATSTGGSLASSTVYRFEVDATDNFGSTTPSAELDAASTIFGTTTTQILVSWYQPTNSTGSRVYFATGTNAFSQYFAATTSGQYNFSTTTSALTGSPVTQTTAYSARFNPLGTSYILGGNLLMGTSTGFILKDTTRGTCALIQLTGGAVATTSHACN